MGRISRGVPQNPGSSGQLFTLFELVTLQPNNRSKQMNPSELIIKAIEGMPPPMHADRCRAFVAALAGRCSGSADPCLHQLAPVLRAMYKKDGEDEIAEARRWISENAISAEAES
jgi:hypothetical protein